MAVNPSYHQPVQHSFPMGGTAEYLRRMNWAATQDRSHELAMREMELLAARQALGLDSRGRPGGGLGSNQFLDAWNQTLQASQGVYNQALQAFGGTHEWMRSASESARRLGGMADTIEQEFQQFRADYAPLEQAFGEQARSELASRQRLGAQLEGLAVADYEGAAGRAVADVAQQADIARQSEARRMASMGIDPTSGRGMAMMSRMGQAEGGQRAMAANMARRGEQERVTNITGQAMQIFDPTRMASMATGIRQAGSSLMQTAAGLRGQETQALRGLATTQGQIAQGMANIGTGMAQNIAGQQADIAGLQMGLQYQQQQNAQNFLGGGGYGNYRYTPIGSRSIAGSAVSPGGTYTSTSQNPSIWNFS